MHPRTTLVGLAAAIALVAPATSGARLLPSAHQGKHAKSARNLVTNIPASPIGAGAATTDPSTNGVDDPSSPDYLQC